MSQYRAAHQNPQGPADGRPTAIQIIQDEGLAGKLEGKVVLITGANQGIGLETARGIHMTGATVYLCVRNIARGQQAIEDISASVPDRKGGLHLVELSLDFLASVRRAAQTFLAQTKTLNVLILNAAAMSETSEETVDGFERNTTPASYPSRLRSIAPTKSLGDLNFERDYDRFIMYSHSKLANIYLANEIERRYGSRGLHGLSLHPGLIITNINRDSLAEDQNDKKPALGGRLNELKPLIKNTAQSAATTVYAALGHEWESRGGKYLNDCEDPGPVDPKSQVFSSNGGYSLWAFDEEKASRLWVE